MLDEKYDWNSILFQFRLMLDNEFVNYFLQSIFTDIYSHSIKIKTFMGKFSYYYNKDVIFVSTKTQTALHNYKTLKRRIVIDGFLVGLGAGFFSVLYRLMLSELDGIRKMLFSTYSTEHILFLIVAFTLFACIVGLLIRWCPLSSGSGIPQIQGELLGIFREQSLHWKRCTKTSLLWFWFRVLSLLLLQTMYPKMCSGCNPLFILSPFRNLFPCSTTGIL